MKILIIKQLFHPEPTARSLDFALELTRQGHDVEVLTSFPSYPKGRIYPEYKQKLFFKEQIEGINVTRVPIYPYQGASGLRRIFNYLSFAISAILLGIWRVKKPDVVFAYQGALPVGLPAIALKIFRGVPFVYDINDIWPDTLTATGMMSDGIAINFVNKWCQFTYKMASHITVLSEGFKEKLVSRNVKADKVSVIYHWSRDKGSPSNQVDPAVKAKFDDESFNFLYAGNVGRAQSLFSVLDAFKSLEETHPLIRLTLLGDGMERDNLIKYAQDKDIKNVHFLDRVDGSMVGQYLSCADVLLVHLKDEPLFRITIPSKIIGYLFAAKPILLGLNGDAQKIINDSEAGLCCEPDDVEDLHSKILEFYNMSQTERDIMCENAARFYSENFTIEKNTQQYIELFEKVSANKNIRKSS